MLQAKSVAQLVHHHDMAVGSRRQICFARCQRTGSGIAGPGIGDVGIAICAAPIKAVDIDHRRAIHLDKAHARDGFVLIKHSLCPRLLGRIKGPVARRANRILSNVRQVSRKGKAVGDNGLCADRER